MNSRNIRYNFERGHPKDDSDQLKIDPVVSDEIIKKKGLLYNQ
jgi:hypothetical protein